MNTPSFSWTRLAWVFLGIVVVIGLYRFPMQVCTDHAFVDETTGSRKGYREWCFGLNTGRWYKESAVERFMRTNQPAPLRQRWTSYAGTGRDVFTRRVSFGHGRPGAVLMLRPETVNDYCELVGDEEKRRIYSVLSSVDQKAIEELSEKIDETLLNQGSQPNGATNRNQPVRAETNQASTAAGSGR